jgi:hypothetical protein
MTEIILEHNHLSGYRFVIAEYGLVGGGLGLLVAYHLAVGPFLDALVWLGTVVNCAAIAPRGSSSSAAMGMDPTRRIATRATQRHALERVDLCPSKWGVRRQIGGQAAP